VLGVARSVRKGDTVNMNLSWLVDEPHRRLATGDPEACALSAEGMERWSYRDLRDHADRYAKGLQDLGVVTGDRVGILLLNSLEYWATYFGILKLGAIAVRLNFRLAPAELQYVLSDSGCKVLCFHARFGTRLEPIRPEVPVQAYVVFQEAGGDGPDWALSSKAWEEGDPVGISPAASNMSDPAMLMYTSGTSGQAKGALWTHGNTLWFAVMQALKWGFSPGTVAMTTGPFYHVGAFEDLLLPALLSRGSAVFLGSGGFSIERALTVMEKERVTDILLYPFMLYELVRYSNLEQHDLSRLKRIVSGGDPLMPWAVEAVRERLPGVELVQAYGLTEGGAISTCLDDAYAAVHPDSVGRPLPLTSVSVVREDGSEAEPGEVGEVMVCSPSVSAGYWNQPNATRETFVDGWCRTGDLGRVTDDGFLVLTGRKKDMIRSGGENIYPAEVERVLTDHPVVMEAAVIAVPDEKFLEVGCAVVVLEAGVLVDDEELLGYCRSYLASYKVPRYVVRVDQLPRNLSGKVTKYALRERYRQIGREPQSSL